MLKKYRRKSEIVEAKIYVKGMEDGTTKFATGIGPLGGVAELPYINASEGNRLVIREGDYILKYECGRKSACSADKFEADYEEVAEDIEKEGNQFVKSEDVTFATHGEVEAIGSVRYEKTISVGEQYVTETIEGSVDDVLKVIKRLECKQAPNTFNLHIEAPEIGSPFDAAKIADNVKKEVENIFRKLNGRV